MARPPDAGSSEAPRQRSRPDGGSTGRRRTVEDAPTPAPERGFSSRSAQKAAGPKRSAPTGEPAARRPPESAPPGRQPSPRPPAARQPQKARPGTAQPQKRQPQKGQTQKGQTAKAPQQRPQSKGQTATRPQSKGRTVSGASARTSAPRKPDTRKPEPGKQAPRTPAPEPATLPELVPEPTGRLNRLMVAPSIEGPRVRMGALWFFLTLAAATSGRWWTAALWSVAAALSAAQTVGAWQLEYLVAAGPDGASGEKTDGTGWTTSWALRWIAAALAAVAPLAAGYGTGLAGVVLIAVAVFCGLGQLFARSRGAGAFSIAVLLAAIASSSVVVAVRIDLWAGLFLILAVSLYDAGSYLMGADAAGRWEGPIAGTIGALAVTFTMATVDPPPFDRAGAWLTGALVAVACVLGQWTASAFLPRTTADARALRRLDAYILAGPTFVACAWLLGS